MSTLVIFVPYIVLWPIMPKQSFSPSFEMKMVDGWIFCRTIPDFSRANIPLSKLTTILGPI